MKILNKLTAILMMAIFTVMIAMYYFVIISVSSLPSILCWMAWLFNIFTPYSAEDVTVLMAGCVFAILPVIVIEKNMNFFYNSIVANMAAIVYYYWKGKEPSLKWWLRKSSKAMRIAWEQNS